MIDLGCHAGGWSQIILERVSREGLVIGVATQQLLMCSPKKVHIHRAVFCLNNEFIEFIHGNVLKSDEFMKLIDGFTVSPFVCSHLNKGDDDPQDLTSNTTGQSLDSTPFFPDFMIGASPSTKLASEDKVLMEPLENHHFVQGDIEKESTVRPQEILLNESTVEVVQQTLNLKVKLRIPKHFPKNRLVNRLVSSMFDFHPGQAGGGNSLRSPGRRVFCDFFGFETKRH